MRIVFMMRHYGYVGRYEEAMRELAARGHELIFAFCRDVTKPFRDDRMRALVAGMPGARYGFLPDPAGPPRWASFAFHLRKLVDYLRYLHPDYANSPKLASRFNRRISPSVRAFFETKGRRHSAWIKLLRRFERAIPTSPAALGYLRSEAPDAVLFTPLVDSNTPFVDYAKAARSLGVPTAVCVASWDNLTNKGLNQCEPDRFLVWNRPQKEEAVKYHGIPAERIVMTGAQTFDKWFSRRPTLSKEDFLRKTNLAGRASYLLYTCSSRFIAAEEVGFVKRWIAAVRGSSRFKETGILVRPHPNHSAQWDGVVFAPSEGVSIYPRWEPFPYPFTEETHADYFDSVHHCDAVVGLNTSALVEAGIQEKPVFTILTEEFKDTQEGTLHFRHLLGGLLAVAGSFEDHVRQLERAAEGEPSHRNAMKAFIREFVRPHGLDRAATPEVVAAIESLSECRAVPARASASDRFLRGALWPLAAAFSLLRPEAAWLRKKSAKSPNAEGWPGEG